MPQIRLSLEEELKMRMRPVQDAKAWEMSPEKFLEIGATGRIYISSGNPPPSHIGTLETPLSFGESEGYSRADIISYYLARRLPSGWVMEYRAGPSEFLRKNAKQIEFAQREIIEDARFEARYYASYIELRDLMKGLSLAERKNYMNNLLDGQDHIVRTAGAKTDV